MSYDSLINILSLLGISLALILSLWLFIKKSRKQKKPLLTEEFKTAVEGIDLNLNDENHKLLDIEEDLLALKELLDHQLITEDEYNEKAAEISAEVQT